MSGIAKYADGGMSFGMEVPWFERREENSQPGTGFLNSSVAGRTDRLPVAVAADSYVIPADVVSGVGQGNSLSGARLLNEALKTGPWGTAINHVGAHSNAPRPPKPEYDKKGGTTHHMPIMVAGGEYTVPPEVVKRLGGGDKTKGHRLLDEMVKRVRAHTLKTIRTLPKPKR